ncbi:MAG: tripartite tricarboxylate transporter substrate binding protein [Betaproteobacteria bacterium]|nr:tripartite tricarboxylate transporter substrate binding protein [Betaproteobacteria bacterium]
MKKLLGISALVVCGGAWAQDTRPIRMIVPFSAGSASDVITRILVDRIASASGQRFVMDNRPAVGGNLGTQMVARATPDGYTFGMSASGPLAANKTLYKDLGYDPERDIQAVSLYASLPNVVVVSAKLPITHINELIDYVKKTPGVAYGSVGNGSAQHLAGAFFEQIVGARMTHVPYKVTANLVTDLISGQAPVSFQLVPNVRGAIKAGQVRPLIVAATRRLTALPEVPTAAEAGIKGYTSAAWFAFIGPAGTPRAAVDKLYKDTAAAIADGAVRARFLEIGAEPMATAPDEFAKFISAEIVKWRGIITKGGISIDGQ